MARCKICRTEFVRRSITHKCCSPDCAEKFTVTQRVEQEQKQARAEFKKRKESLKTRRDYIKEAQVAFNAYVRERDKYELCISCKATLGTGSGTTGGAFDCGHYRSIGSAPHLRFNPANAHGQCKKCNRWGSGRAVDYRLGLIQRIGLAAVERLESDQTIPKWTKEELIGIKVEYRAKLKELKTQRGEA